MGATLSRADRGQPRGFGRGFCRCSRLLPTRQDEHGDVGLEPAVWHDRQGNAESSCDEAPRGAANKWKWKPLLRPACMCVPQFNNKTAEDGNNKWTVDVCGGIYSNVSPPPYPLPPLTPSGIWRLGNPSHNSRQCSCDFLPGRSLPCLYRIPSPLRITFHATMHHRCTNNQNARS
jgi:hypothetical protein